MPKVSVIIPVYGVEKYIERCARSLFDQTLDDIEYLFIDDCTPDKSIEILKKVLDRYPHRKKQVLIHRMECNSGQAKVREWGMKHMTGEYVIHCDSDDWAGTEMYKMLYEKAVREKADLVLCDYQWHDGEKSLQTKKGCLNTDKDSLERDLLNERCEWALWNKLFKKSLIDKIEYYPSNNMGEDMVMVMQMLFSCTKIVYLPHTYYFYYFNPDSILRQNSPASIIKKYSQYNANVNLLLKFYSSKKQLKKLADDIGWLKYTVRKSLYFNYKEVRAIRKRVYPLIEFKLLFNPSIRARQKKELLKVLIDQLLRRI